MTPLTVSIVAAVASIALLLVVFELIRSRRLRERYALLWLATGVVLLVLSAWRRFLQERKSRHLLDFGARFLNCRVKGLSRFLRFAQLMQEEISIALFQPQFMIMHHHSC